MVILINILWGTVNQIMRIIHSFIHSFFHSLFLFTIQCSSILKL